MCNGIFIIKLKLIPSENCYPRIYFWRGWKSCDIYAQRSIWKHLFCRARIQGKVFALVRLELVFISFYIFYFNIHCKYPKSINWRIEFLTTHVTCKIIRISYYTLQQTFHGYLSGEKWTTRSGFFRLIFLERNVFYSKKTHF